MFTVRRRDHVQMVSVKVSFSGAILSRVAVGLGVNAIMIAFSHAAGTTITSRFASEVGGSGDWCAITGRTKCREIPEQPQIRRNRKDLRLKKVE
ncbi:hypothetical protein LSG31_16825 [Fodinisporobacter ferrooxydans]|uniref:Uncharacterized protein n=1 Tax=Fodinisporobacter ferrooxydans TaxID=2901836 RepID=A0ABY4CG87_9BACL|nr:hypothetical protein LSG31_16825 [Alicyclobacillaceae bacterium MYW30-H2]